MTIKRNLFLAALLAGLLVWVFRFEIPEEEAKVESAKLLQSLVASQIEAIQVKNAHGEFSFSNANPNAASTSKDADSIDADSWKLDGVAYQKVDAGSLNSLWQSVRSLSFEKPIPADEVEADRGIYGLKQPEISVRVKAQGKEFGVDVGGTNRYVGKRYVSRLNDQGIYLLTDSVSASANKPRDDFRTRMPVRYEENDVSAIELIKGKQSITIEASADAGYRLKAPLEARASNVAVMELLREVRTLRADEFLDALPVPGKGGVITEALRITVTLKESLKRDPISVLLHTLTPPKGAGAVQYFFTIDGTPGAFKLVRDQTSSLFKPVKDYREKRFLDFQVFAVKGATFEISGQEKVELTKEGDKDSWKVNAEAAEAPFITDLFNAVREVEAVDYLDAKDDLGFKAPLMKITLRFDQGAERILTIGKRLSKVEGDEARYTAAVGDLSEPFVISGATLKKITPKREVLKKSAEG